MVERLRALADRIAEIMALASGALFLLLAAYITLDASSRYLFGASTAVSDEYGGYALALGVAFALAHALRRAAHVRIDILLPRLPLRAQAALNYLAFAVMAAFAILVAWALWLLAIESYAFDARSMSHLRTPVVVPQALTALGFSALAIEALLLIAAAALESVRSGSIVSPAGSRSDDDPLSVR